MVVVGAGLVGVATAWLLLNRGHGVRLIDPGGTGAQPAGAGTSAALGVLMAQVYRRSSGRGWRLRQRSLQLWQDWSHQLAERGSPLPLRPGLLQLAADPQELELQQRLVLERTAKGFPLRQLSPGELAQLQPQLPDAVGTARVQVARVGQHRRVVHAQDVTKIHWGKAWRMLQKYNRG